MNKFAFLFVILEFFSISSAYDYCQPGLCKKTEKHVACGASDELSSSCPSDAKFIDLTLMKDKIVDSHNDKRNQVAGGKIPKHLPAVRMATIQWDNELAYLAGINVKSCNYEHDECRNTHKFKFARQNLAKDSWYGSKAQVEVLVLDQIEKWFSESEDSDMSRINNVGSTENPVTGHFTVMVAELSIKVGCAAVRSSEYMEGKKWETLTTACNYAHNNVVGSKIYRSGPAASECTTGTNPQYPFLCSVNESYDPNVPLK